MKIFRTRFRICLMWSYWRYMQTNSNKTKVSGLIKQHKPGQLPTHDVATHINDFIYVIIPLNVWFYKIHQFFCQFLKSIYKLNKFFSQQMTYIFDIFLQFVKIALDKFKTNLLVASQKVNTEEILLHTFFKYSILTNRLTFLKSISASSSKSTLNRRLLDKSAAKSTTNFMTLL